LSTGTKTFIVAAIVEHKSVVLQKIAGMFSRRSFNIENISVGPIEEPSLARITITVNGDERMLEQLIKQLSKLIDVVKISKLDPASAVARELALVKVHAPNATVRSDIIQYANIFRSRVIDASPDSLILEITGGASKIDAFIDLMQDFGIKEMARTGTTALARGPRNIKTQEK
jgi:acetolactate synthase-1/3 small subunit